MLAKLAKESQSHMICLGHMFRSQNHAYQLSCTTLIQNGIFQMKFSNAWLVKEYDVIIHHNTTSKEHLLSIRVERFFRQFMDQNLRSAATLHKSGLSESADMCTRTKYIPKTFRGAHRIKHGKQAMPRRKTKK